MGKHRHPARHSEQPEGFRRLANRAALFAGSTLAVLLTACAGPTVAELKADLAARDAQIEKKDHELAAGGSTIGQLREQLLKAQGLDPQRWQRAFRPVALQIASLSGGADYDAKSGDDGVTVYLRPIDRDGDVVKVAGEIRVQLYDLANPPGRQLIGEYRVPADRCGELWYGKLMTQHFTVKCSWQSGPPAHDEITIRATFIDDLTGDVMTVQAAVKVKLAGKTAG